MFVRMGTTVAVAGASGYAGGELLRLLAGHPDLQVGPVTAHASAGERLGAVHPHLSPWPTWCWRRPTPDALADADLVFLALPHGESGRLAAALPADLPVVDLGADHRLADPQAWARLLRRRRTPAAGPTACPSCPASATLIAGGHRVAATGCYAAAITLALAPLIAAGLVEPGRRGGGRRLRHLRRRPRRPRPTCSAAR